MASALASGGTSWNAAIEVPGTAALNVGGSANVNSVSCAAAGECTAGGYYTDGSGHSQAFVASEKSGVWGDVEPGAAALNVGGLAGVTSVSCAAVGDCAAGGGYTDGSGQTQAFVMSETNGVWSQAIEVPGLAALNTDGDAGVRSVSCAAAGDCAAGGTYLDGAEQVHAFVANEKNGVWGEAMNVPGTASNGGDYDYAVLESISCAAKGECAAGGWYDDASGQSQAFVVNETNGVWGDAIKVLRTAALNSGTSYVNSVSCAAAGHCAAGGDYWDGSREHPFVVNEKNGVWGDAIDVPGITAVGDDDIHRVESVSCPTVDYCAAAGDYTDGAGRYQPFVVSRTNGTWGKAIPVPGVAALTRGCCAFVSSVSCPAAGKCAAGGWYANGRGPNTQQAFVVSQTHGIWGKAIKVPGTAALNTRGGGFVNSVSCGAAGDCAAGGGYTDSSGGQAFVVNSGTYLRAGTTTCDGTYRGTGSNVVVPAHATCTLLPGTNVTGNITVRRAGNLNLDGVTIGGSLTILPGVTRVCGSTVGGDVKATGGSLILGGPNCAANTIAGSVVVQYEPYRLRVWGNTINGNLTVNYATGRIDAIVNNTVTGNLLVQHSGPPVEVSRNHAAAATCIHNTNQTGSGNVATGTNTCPH